MNSSAMPRSACSLASSSRICAWMVKSSAWSGVGGDQHFRIDRQRSRDHDALLQPAGELEGITVRCAARDPGCRREPARRGFLRFSLCPPRCAARSPRWICRPTVSTGFSAVEGSWKIIATRRPDACARIAASGRRADTMPSRPAAAAMRPASRSQPHEDSAVIDLPQPDSPTRAKHSPCAARADAVDCAYVAPLRLQHRTEAFNFGTALMPQRAPCEPADRIRRAPRRQTGSRRAPART